MTLFAARKRRRATDLAPSLIERIPWRQVATGAGMLAGVALVYWALIACAPAPLPGDELWTMRQNLGEAISLVLRLGTKACFTGDALGSFGLWLGSRTTGVLLVLLAAIVLWEFIGRNLRRSFFRMNGGHVVLAGHYDDLRELAQSRRSLAGTGRAGHHGGAAVAGGVVERVAAQHVPGQRQLLRAQGGQAGLHGHAARQHAPHRRRAAIGQRDGLAQRHHAAALGPQRLARAHMGPQAGPHALVGLA